MVAIEAASALAHSANTEINSPAEVFVVVKDAAWVLYSGLWPGSSGQLDGSASEENKTTAYTSAASYQQVEHIVFNWYPLLFTICLNIFFFLRGNTLG